MKKGAISVLTVIIISLIGLLVMGYSLKSIAEVMQGATDKKMCKQSVELKASAKILERDYMDVPIRCKSNYELIENKKELDKIGEIITNDFYDCWDQFGRGEVDFLNAQREFIEWQGPLSTYDTYCFICTKIIFSEELKGLKLTGIKEAINQNQLINNIFPEDQINKLESSIVNKPIYIAFVAVKGEKDMNWLLRGSGMYILYKKAKEYNTFFIVGSVEEIESGCQQK